MMLTNILLILLILAVLFCSNMENYEQRPASVVRELDEQSSVVYNMFSPNNMNMCNGETVPIKLSNPLSASDIFYNESKNCPNTSPIFYK